MKMMVINAEKLILGRLASHTAKLLLNGEEVIIVNAEKVVITGTKKRIFADYKQKRDVGGVRKGPFYPRTPDRILRRTVRGMIPYKKPSGKKAYSRLKVYIGVPKELKKENFKTVKGASAVDKIKYVELGEVSRQLGAKF